MSQSLTHYTALQVHTTKLLNLLDRLEVNSSGHETKAIVQDFYSSDIALEYLDTIADIRRVLFNLNSQTS